MPLTLKITEQERAQRLIEVRESLASVRLEGLEPGPEAIDIFERYADGHITLEQFGLEIDSLHDRKYGPLPVPRNGRS